MNGFSQPASSQLPPGTWENGIYDYDDLKKNYLPTYTRYWDDQSKVPFLYNAPKGMWISYDDLQSNTVKNNYIIQQQLGGGMFWELSGDRSAELIGNTYSQLNGGKTPPTPASTTTPSGSTTTTTASGSTTTTPSGSTTTGGSTSPTTSGDIPAWTVNKAYNVGDRVTYNGQIYECIEAHTSQADWTPDTTPSLWTRISF